MTIISGIFNSVNGDRKYNAKWFARYFSLFVGNGVFPSPSSGLQVMEGSNMQTVVKAGDGWINGYFIVNDSDHILQHDVADGVLKRIDRVVMRLNYLTRKIEIVIKKGSPTSSPVAPSLQRDTDVHELALADVLINNGVTQISQANITDNRLNKQLCGIVHGLIDQVDMTTIFNQYNGWFGDFTVEKQAEFEAWVESLKDILEGDVAANLAARITTVEGNLTTHKADYVAHPGIATTTNVGNAYAVTLTPAPSAYANAMGLVLTINASSTAAATINVNGLGAIPIKKANGNAVTNLKANGVYTLRYSASAFILQGEGGEYGNAVAKDVRIGKTFGTEDGIKTGSLVLEPNFVWATAGEQPVFEKSPASSSGSSFIQSANGLYLGQSAHGSGNVLTRAESVNSFDTTDKSYAIFRLSDVRYSQNINADLFHFWVGVVGLSVQANRSGSAVVIDIRSLSGVQKIIMQCERITGYEARYVSFLVQEIIFV